MAFGVLLGIWSLIFLTEGLRVSTAAEATLKRLLTGFKPDPNVSTLGFIKDFFKVTF